MGHVRDRWTDPNPAGGRRVRNTRWGVGKRWQARWTEAGYERSKAFASKDAAEVWLAEKELGIVRRPGSSMTLDELARRWQAAQAHHRPSTAEAVGRALSAIILPTLGDHMIADLTRHDLQAAINEWAGRWSASRVRIAWSHVGAMLALAEQDGLLEKVPSGVKLPKIEREPVVPLTVAQVDTIAAAVPARWRSLVIVAAASGLRSGELRGLTWDRVQDDVLIVDRQLVGADRLAPRFGPPKSKASVRRVRVGPSAVAALAAQRERWPSEDLVWRTRLGTPLSRSGASKVWRDTTMDMGLRERSGWHDLRHFHASLLIASGLSVRAVADRLGHADPAETLQTYAHLWPSDEGRAVSAVEAALAGGFSARTDP